MSRLTDEILKREFPHEEDFADSSVWSYLLIILIVVLFAMFVGEMLFGHNSLEVLLHLKKDEKILQQKIVRLQKENAELQRRCFEYLNLQPEPEKEGR